ncbi:MAG TPA: hypothetical protein VFY05_03805 [Candidatus Angelobacter sp.]|nr:hypothetical protein [Candidatus Angelobacter sp.]
MRRLKRRYSRQGYWHPGQPGTHRTSSSIQSGELPEAESGIGLHEKNVAILRLAATNAERKLT